MPILHLPNGINIIWVKMIEISRFRFIFGGAYQARLLAERLFIYNPAPFLQ